jgi:hypothetical protein
VGCRNFEGRLWQKDTMLHMAAREVRHLFIIKLMVILRKWMVIGMQSMVKL